MTPTPAHPSGRNDPCHCGSGRKYKHCCLAKDEAEARAAREKAADEAPAAPAPDTPDTTARKQPQRPKTYQPWKRSATNTHGFQRMSTPRKVGGS